MSSNRSRIGRRRIAVSKHHLHYARGLRVWILADQQGEVSCSKGIDVAEVVDIRRFTLLRTHEVRRAHQLTSLRHLHCVRDGMTRQSKVCDLHRPIRREKQVGRFDIAMNQSGRVSSRQALARIDRDPCGLSNRVRIRFFQRVSGTATGNKFEGDVVRGFVF